MVQSAVANLKSCAFVGLNTKMYVLVCIKPILVHICAFVRNVITYISLRFLYTADI
jgi:hypothetical protein